MSLSSAMLVHHNWSQKAALVSATRATTVQTVYNGLWVGFRLRVVTYHGAPETPPTKHLSGK
jgi:hypothetical protein